MVVFHFLLYSIETLSLSLFSILCAKIQRHRALEANTKYDFRGHDFCSMECVGRSDVLMSKKK